MMYSNVCIVHKNLRRRKFCVRAAVHAERDLGCEHSRTDSDWFWRNCKRIRAVAPARNSIHVQYTYTCSVQKREEHYCRQFGSRETA